MRSYTVMFIYDHHIRSYSKSHVHMNTVYDHIRPYMIIKLNHIWTFNHIRKTIYEHMFIYEHGDHIWFTVYGRHVHIWFTIYDHHVRIWTWRPYMIKPYMIIMFIYDYHIRLGMFMYGVHIWTYGDSYMVGFWRRATTGSRFWRRVNVVASPKVVASGGIVLAFVEVFLVLAPGHAWERAVT